MAVLKRIFTLSVCTLLLTSCAAKTSPDEEIRMEIKRMMGIEEQVKDRRHCARNFSTTGSVSSGKYFSSTRVYKDVSKSAAISNVIGYILSLGWSIYNVNTDLGLISAIPGVIYGEDMKSSLEVIVSVIVTEERNNLIKIECTFYSSAFQYISEEDAKEEICILLDSATKPIRKSYF